MTAQTSDYAPKLLLNPQRLRRLQRDRDRQTVRWLNFEDRVQSAADSPERGFELALYFAVTRDEKRGREAAEWALAHRCDRRQVALILDWCGDLMAEGERQQLTRTACDVKSGGEIEGIRDDFFSRVSGTGNAAPDRWKNLLSLLEAGDFADARSLYAACEYLSAVRLTQHVDLREEAPEFFSSLPLEFLLSLKPENAEHPDWMMHIAALALVSLDPNLPDGQYLQGWAMEPRQMIRKGPGVAYEFLWADPYLPAIAYQNLDPWVYDPAGRLFARTTWDADACWINISPGHYDQNNCPMQAGAPLRIDQYRGKNENWDMHRAQYGSLTMVNMVRPCVDIPRKNNNETIILWHIKPLQHLVISAAKPQIAAEADAAGMWRVPRNVEGKVCEDTRHVPQAP